MEGPLPAKTCIHHWLIEPASGPGGSPGKCRKCGSERSFLNHVDIGFAIARARQSKDRETYLAPPNRRVR